MAASKQTMINSKRVFTHTLYSYVRKANDKYAKTHGRKMFGSHSAYVDALISRDRGVKPILGAWKSEGESRKLRVVAAKKKSPVKAKAKARKVTKKKAKKK